MYNSTDQKLVGKLLMFVDAEQFIFFSCLVMFATLEQQLFYHSQQGSMTRSVPTATSSRDLQIKAPSKKMFRFNTQALK